MCNKLVAFCRNVLKKLTLPKVKALKTFAETLQLNGSNYVVINTRTGKAISLFYP